jgi:hypothetical protein
VPNGNRFCLLLLKFLEKIYAPLTAGLLHPYRGGRTVDDSDSTNSIASTAPLLPLSMICSL